MYRLLEFIRNISMLLLFLALEGAAILFYAHSDSYAQAKIVALTANVTGGVGGAIEGISNYFSLNEQNSMLLERVMELEGEVERLKALHSDSTLMAHSLIDESGVNYVAARVVRNSTNKSKNYILINRGYTNGVRERMAVITAKGEIIGSVVGSTERYAVVMSLLNREFRSSGKIKGDTHAGGVSWSGESRYLMQLTDLSKYAEPFEGAEIVTTGLSQIFPEGLKLGRVVDYTLNELDGSYLVNFEIAADMSALNEVIVLNSRLLQEGRAVMELFEREGKIKRASEEEEKEFDEASEYEGTDEFEIVQESNRE